MNRLHFFRNLLAAVAATKAGKDFNIEVPSSASGLVSAPILPGINGKMFTINIGPGQYVMGDMFRTNDKSLPDFIVTGHTEDGTLIAKGITQTYDSRIGEQVLVKLEEHPIAKELDEPRFQHQKIYSVFFEKSNNNE